ncbi:MAG: phosphomannomutase/phosphoglucomutase [Halieaceae bacterium]|nr:phosphomannomutase/phosphoglucomutase [Halieaceae bacterium]
MAKNNNRDEERGPEAAQGVLAGSNYLQRYWLYALLGILLPLLAASGYLLAMRDAALQEQQVVRAARSLAVQQAAQIEQQLLQYQARLLAASNAPLALSAIASGREEDLALVEKAMLDYFPEVASLRLIALGELGTAALDAGDIGLRNNIEIDVVRKTSEGEAVTPESYQFEGRWLTSLARSVQHPRQADRSAVILATLDNSVFAESLGAIGAELGRSSLSQTYNTGSFTNTSEIAATGNGAAAEFAAEASLNNGTWTIRFTPSAQMLSLYQVDGTGLLVVMGVLALVVLVAMLLFLVGLQRALAADVDKIIAGAERKGDYQVGLPALLKLARLLRRMTVQQSNQQTPRGTSRPAQKAAPAAPPGDGDSAAAADTGSAAAPEPKKAAPAVPMHIFRAYDIRGIVEQELTDTLVSRIGKAFGTLAGEQDQQAIIVASDGRTSSPAIKNSLVKALLSSGRDVVDIGLVPTPVLYYATHTLDIRSGIMVTASHNPADYNGFKITLDGKPFAGNDLQMLKERMVGGKFSSGSGRLAKQDVMSDYIDAVLGDIAISNPLKIVVDAGNGAAGELAPEVLEGLGCEVTRLHCDIDGNFPNHHPDPSVDENLSELQASVKHIGADFGVAYDGDGDRLCVVTAEGEIVRNDKLLMLFAQDVVARNPGADVVFDVKCSRHLTQLVSKHGGRPILWKTGHAFMREKVAETGALLGGEFSGHIYFGERWYGFDDAIYTTARLAELMSGTGMDLTTLLSEFPETSNTPEIRIPCSEDGKFEVTAKLAESGDFSPGKVTNIDGVRVDYNDGWGLLRASNTGPALIARFEANDADALERIKQQFRAQLKQAAPDLEPGF